MYLGKLASEGIRGHGGVDASGSNKDKKEWQQKRKLGRRSRQQRHPPETAAQVRERLQEGADDLIYFGGLDSQETRGQEEEERGLKKEEEEWAQILRDFEKDWVSKKKFVEDIKQNGLPSFRQSAWANNGPALHLHPIQRLHNISSVEWETRCVKQALFAVSSFLVRSVLVNV
jgi:hypothetical protein